MVTLEQIMALKESLEKPVEEARAKLAAMKPYLAQMKAPDDSISSEAEHSHSDDKE